MPSGVEICTKTQDSVDRTGPPWLPCRTTPYSAVYGHVRVVCLCDQQLASYMGVARYLRPTAMHDMVAEATFARME